MRNKKHRAARAWLQLAGASIVAFAAAIPTAHAADPYWVGVTGPLSGQDAQYGEQRKRGFDLALEQVNAKGGINGHQLNYDFEDSRSDPRQAVSIAQKFVDDKRILLELCDLSSGASMAASPIYQRAGLVRYGADRTAVHDGFAKINDVPSVIFGKFHFDPQTRRVAGAKNLDLVVKDSKFALWDGTSAVHAQ